MAGVSTGGGGHGGKKSVDQDIPLIAFIDLLLCCVMFVLVTAVWNQLARFQANQAIPGQPQTESDTPPPPRWAVQVQGQGFVVASSAGDNITIPKLGDRYDVGELATKLHDLHQSDPNRKQITIEPEDGVMYENVVQT